MDEAPDVSNSFARCAEGIPPVISGALGSCCPDWQVTSSDSSLRNASRPTEGHAPWPGESLVVAAAPRVADETPAPEAPHSRRKACPFFLRGRFRGRCLAREKCPMAHVTPDWSCVRCHRRVTSVTDHLQQGCVKSLLKSKLKGDRRNGKCPNFLSGHACDEDCDLLHVDSANRCLLCHEECADACIHWRTCKEWLKMQEEVDASRSIECSICFRRFSRCPPPLSRHVANGQLCVTLAPTEMKRRSDKQDADTFSTIAVLPNCRHLYCMDCILAWRGSVHRSVKGYRIEYVWNEELNSSEITRVDYDGDEIPRFQCPLCRAKAPFIVPTDRAILNEERRSLEVHRYLSRLKSVRCCYYTGLRGSCRHGDACFYSHFPANK